MRIVQFREAGLLKIGDQIASRFRKDTLEVIASYPVKRIHTRRGCNGIHVNDRECWDGLVPVVVTL